MNSLNFEILRSLRPELSDLGAFAEHYAHSDPVSATIKLRSFAELLTREIYRLLKFPQPVPNDFVNLLTTYEFKSAIPPIVVDQLHAIRKTGNIAAHANQGDTPTAIRLIQQAAQVGTWFAAQFHKVPTAQIRPFQPIPAAIPAVQANKAALEELARHKAKLEQMSAELAQTQEKYQAAEQKLEELQKIGQAGQNTLSLLKIDEATTRRRLIDIALAQAGWKVGANGANTEEVSQEYEVAGQPTGTGKGFVDYVLWGANGKPLGLVEAKKTARNAEEGRKQAELYADPLEKAFGQRPMVFYTNGHEIYVLDDAQVYPPRRIFGFYSQDTLEYRVTFQRSAKLPLDSIAPNPQIINRIYQFEAVKRTCEDFAQRERKALIVQATGTGKTRVAIALTDVLIRANWVKRVLFLCDRRELRKQAKNAFTDFLPEPLTILNASTAAHRNKRIYLATYPAMMEAYQSYDPGFFDLIIADESHRSIYNYYGDLFKYFDCLQVGLTATPVGFINRNTFRLFNRVNGDATAEYSLERAIEEGWLVPYETYKVTTAFLREGIRYDQLTEEQKRQIEEDGIDPDLVDHDQSQIDKVVFNKDTNRMILRNLMENGIRDAFGQRIGKSIIFARSHEHAVLLQQLFDEMYPQYGGMFCRVIDYQMERADQLIDDFKEKPYPVIAISVDMLDTGIDVPQIVNLVFAKPVKSRVKFWQMIGRGTRLCKDLFGPGKDKKCFRIFDHWGNFDFFGQARNDVNPSQSRSLMEQVFQSRIELAQEALNAAHVQTFNWVARLISADIAALPDDTIAVKEKWVQKQGVLRPGVLEQWAASTVDVLRREIAPLMQWVDLYGTTAAHRFDLLIAQMQLALLRGAASFDDLKADLLNRVANLQMNLNPVREKAAVIQCIRSADFWRDVTVDSLEEIRQELRGIMRYQVQGNTPRPAAIVYDIKEDSSEVQVERRSSLISSVDLAVYRQRVYAALEKLFDTNPTLEKIRLGLPVSDHDLQALVSLVLTQHPDINLNDLLDFYSDTAAHLDDILRSIVGLKPELVRTSFTEFVQKHPGLNSKQIQFINMLTNHITRNGGVSMEKLYDEPFTRIHSDGMDGVFTNEKEAQELLALIQSFQPQRSEGTITQ
jgi:type I restriction enzyme, R subunit